MPPPTHRSKSSNRSKGDHEREISKSDFSNRTESSFENDTRTSAGKYDGVGIVKSFLGPSFEDAVLKTFEFGKSLIQRVDDSEPLKENKNERKLKSEGKDQRPLKSSVKEGGYDGKTKTNMKTIADGRLTKKRIVFTAKLNKDIPLLKQGFDGYGNKLSKVAKIRSLDSDLKQLAPSPEKIKRQLEALIQINRDEPPEHAGHRIIPRKSKFQTEFTVMPSFCVCKNDADVDACSSADNHSMKRISFGAGQNSASRLQSSSQDQQDQQQQQSTASQRIRKRYGVQSGICQAPELLTSALGPTLDVSIIDNLKMMRNLFKCDSGKGEGANKTSSVAGSQSGAGQTGPTSEYTPQVQPLQPEQNAKPPFMPDELSMKDSLKDYQPQLECRIMELKKIIEELQMKEEYLLKQIEEEEKERECKRRAFEEEEKKLCNMKACLDGLIEEEQKKECMRKASATKCYEEKLGTLKSKISCAEEKLAKLKDQYDAYKKEIMETKNRKEMLKRNKSLLDAWDVIASRACHTRLPSFSKACELERKQLNAGDNPANLHCCFLPMNPHESESSKSLSIGRSRSQTRNGCQSKNQSRGPSTINLDSYCPTSKETVECCKQPAKDCFHSKKETPFPIQRNITCGLHKTLKPCCCSGDHKQEVMGSNSDDKILKATAPMNGASKGLCRSRSETAVKRDKNAKIVKVMWAVTRINIFQDNCRTYEVMDATTTPPNCLPNKTEGIFVVKNTQKKMCASASTCVPPKKRLGQQC